MRGAKIKILGAGPRAWSKVQCFLVEDNGYVHVSRRVASRRAVWCGVFVENL